MSAYVLTFRDLMTLERNGGPFYTSNRNLVLLAFQETLAETHSCFFLISPKIFLFHQNFEVFANLKLRYEKLVPIKIIVCCFYSIGRCVSGSPKDKRRAIESD